MSLILTRPLASGIIYSGRASKSGDDIILFARGAVGPYVANLAGRPYRHLVREHPRRRVKCAWPQRRTTKLAKVEDVEKCLSSMNVLYVCYLFDARKPRYCHELSPEAPTLNLFERAVGIRRRRLNHTTWLANITHAMGDITHTLSSLTHPLLPQVQTEHVSSSLRFAFPLYVRHRLQGI